MRALYKRVLLKHKTKEHFKRALQKSPVKSLVKEPYERDI